jgi:enamine deaminase RidA (YjgF/YER057c/UK114 family)
MAQVVAVEGARKYVYLSGQVARDTNGNCVGAGDMRAQMIQVGENIIAGLKEAGATFANVVKSNTYVTNMAEYLKHADLRAQYFCNPIAASTTIEVKGLVRPEFMIEIEVVAMV